MVTIGLLAREEFSTERSRRTPLAHNRGMTAAGAPRELGRFLTIADVADVLNISALEATHLVTSGQIPAIRVGTHRHWRIERPLLDAFIEAQYLASEAEVRWNGFPSNVIDFDAVRTPRTV